MSLFKKAVILLFTVSVLFCFHINAEEGEWVQLFDGKTLTGWTQHNGKAEYKVEDNAIVGNTVFPSPNSFLCTKKVYDNFELLFEVKVDSGLNSGIQIRSKLKQGSGRVYGPQVEIEMSPGQSGWIYGEGTGLKWLSPEPKSKDPKIKKNSFIKNDEWNSYRIIADGNNIQTWINGNKVADLTHKEIYKSHPEGFIGLQVHSIKKGKGPFSVRWRNIRIKELQ